MIRGQEIIVDLVERIEEAIEDRCLCVGDDVLHDLESIKYQAQAAIKTLREIELETDYE